MVFTSTAPGVILREETQGAASVTANHNRIYYLGTASNLADNREAGTPYLISSVEDFTNQFGSSSALTLNTLAMLFNFYPQCIVYYTAAGKAIADTLTLSAPATDGPYRLTFTGAAADGTDIVVAHNAVSTESLAEVTQALVDALNNEPALNTTLELEPDRNDDGTPNYATGVLSLRSKSGSAIAPYTVSNRITRVAFDSSAAMTATDWTDAAKTLPKESMNPGFLVCPEAFYSLTEQVDRTAVQQAMEAAISNPSINWVAIVDSGPPAIISEPGAMRAERENYTSTLGHSLYIGPWCFDSDSDYVSPAAMQAVLACRRYSVETFAAPLATAKYPFNGIIPAFALTYQERAELNEDNINVVTVLRGRGTCVFGARTLSNKPVYRFANARVILNIYERSLFETLVVSDVVFQNIDGQDVLFNQVKQVADALCYRFWQAQAFFGATPEIAFENVCDRSNNPDFDIQQGVINLQSSVIASPTAEKVVARVSPVPIGELSA